MSQHSPGLTVWLSVSAVILAATGLAFIPDLFKDKQADPSRPQIYTNFLGMEFVPIPGGQYTMGRDAAVAAAGAAGESPAHTVEVASFYLGKYEVTQAQWEAIMGGNPSLFPNPLRPVDQVSWYDVQTFIQRLNRREGRLRYRLPAEAEWEYAARAGGAGRWFFGEDAGLLSQFAWVGRDADQGSMPVGRKAPNPWGLFDMYGNVWEWVEDCWHPDYQDAPGSGQAWPGGDCGRHMVRGGGWNSTADYARSMVRGGYDPALNDAATGFRLAMTP